MGTPRVVKSLRDMEIDEISVVDRGANQHAPVVIAKRAPEEDHMPEFYIQDENGELSPLDPSQAEAGMTVFDEDGAEYTLEAEEAAAEDQRELAEVGKSAFFSKREPVASGGPSFAEQVKESISKALSDEERDEIITKAFDTLAEETRQNREIAKAERDLRLTREYIAKADEYGVPGIASEDLGPVLYRAAEALSYEDCAIIAKALEIAGEMGDALFNEIGHEGGGANSDVMDMVNGYAEEQVSKTEDFSKAEAVVGIIDSNPEAYEQYLADQRSAR